MKNILSKLWNEAPRTYARGTSHRPDGANHEPEQSSVHGLHPAMPCTELCSGTGYQKTNSSTSLYPWSSWYWDNWKKIAHKLGVFQSRIILSIFYFTLLLPFGLIFSLFKDELQIKKKRQSTWLTKIQKEDTIEDMRKQY